MVWNYQTFQFTKLAHCKINEIKSKRVFEEISQIN